MAASLNVIGLGYVGLPTAVVFANAGLDVLGVDTNPEVVAGVNAGRPHFVEPGLNDLLEQVTAGGKLSASTAPTEADVYVIAVPTPFGDKRQPDLTHVEAAARAIAPVLRPGALVVLESTSPVGATSKVAGWLSEARSDLAFPPEANPDVRIAYCPERVLPGQVLHEVINNERIIGGMTPDCASAAQAFFRNAVRGACHLTDDRTAEMAKLTENAFRDVNIAFANELSVICHDLGVDAREMIAFANRHPRVDILNPGPGVGGHCIAVDPWFIVDSARGKASLMRTAREVNDAKPNWVAERVAELADGVAAPVIACMGLAYKPNIDDLRESPSIEVVRLLLHRAVGKVLIADPYVTELPLVLEGSEMVDTEEAVRRADVVVFLTGHNDFKEIPDAALEGKRVLDSCGLLGARG
jgi:UDP-N-acetyl-D-mannosaminuronic acid dehydrogenase